MIDLGVPLTIAAIVCVVVTTVIRLLAVRFGWSLPEQRELGRIPRMRWPRFARRQSAAQTADRTAERTETGAIPRYRIDKGE